MPIPQLTYKDHKRLNNSSSSRRNLYDSRRNHTLQRGKYNKKNKRSFKLKVFLFLLKAALFLFAAGAIAFAFLLWRYSKDLPAADKLIERDIALSTKIYDRAGETILYDVHGEQKRTMVSLDEIPQYAKNATITAEDRDFYTHHGFDLKGIIRAILTNLLRGTLHGPGGSTITQQLVKNAVLSSEKTYSRKLKELVLSYRIENKFSKDEILKMYLNEIPYGSTVYGIEAAAQTFFNKKASKLTLAESAILASLPKAPTYYSPYGNNKDKLIGRHQYVLDSMVEQGYITKEAAEEAKKETLNFNPLTENIIAPHFVMYVKEMLAEKYGEDFMEQSGLKVITTLDLDKQKKAEEAIKTGVEKAKEFNAGNGALVAIDPKTGQILAMVGSRDYFDTENEGNFNVALAKRQPGSSFKPIVYTALLEKGYTTETILFDVATNFKPKNDTAGKAYIPLDYDEKERGPITIRKALQGSLNIPAVKALYLAGLDNVLDLAKKLGYTTLQDKNRYGLSLVLGGGEVTLLEHTAAYGILAREGIFNPAVAILKIEDKDGNVIEEFKENGTRVIDEEIVRKMNDILSDDSARSYIFGSNSKLTLKGRPVCAKTGTTNDYRDAWTMGYTPSLVAGVWVGNNDNSEMKKGEGGTRAAAPIWNEFMTKVLGDGNKGDSTPVEEFKKPKEDFVDKVMLNGQSNNETLIKIDKVSGKIATDFCPESYVEEKKYGSVHSILYYVSKDKPRGDIPENPSVDPQFAGWETAVLKWATSTKELTLENPPTEKCFLHNLENKPVLNIVYPSDKDTVQSKNIEIRVDATAPKGIHHIDYYIDDTLAQTVATYPFNLSYPAVKIANGFHTIKAKAYDDVENFNEASIEINLMIGRDPISAYFEAPQQNASFSSSSFPIKFVIKISDPLNSQSIKILSQKDGETSQIIKTFSDNEILSDTLEFTWGDNPVAGNYKFYIEAIDKKNRYTRSEELEMKILR
ncbi:MAG: PBP1A family penicillin-binding protein [bacterium]